MDITMVIMHMKIMAWRIRLDTILQDSTLSNMIRRQAIITVSQNIRHTDMSRISITLADNMTSVTPNIRPNITVTTRNNTVTIKNIMDTPRSTMSRMTLSTTLSMT